MQYNFTVTTADSESAVSKFFHKEELRLDGALQLVEKIVSCAIENNLDSNSKPISFKELMGAVRHEVGILLEEAWLNDLDHAVVIATAPLLAKDMGMQGVMRQAKKKPEASKISKKDIAKIFGNR